MKWPITQKWLSYYDRGPPGYVVLLIGVASDGKFLHCFSGRTGSPPQ